MLTEKQKTTACVWEYVAGHVDRYSEGTGVHTLLGGSTLTGVEDGWATHVVRWRTIPDYRLAATAV